MEKSDSIKEIAKALLVFHSKVQKIAKSENNPFFKSKYADLPSVLEGIQEPLQESGLCFVQFPDVKSLTTILMHAESGEFMQASYDLQPEKINPQGMGSAITYARRYALGAILGLNTDKDDDGNKGSEPKKEKVVTPPVAVTPPAPETPLETISDEWVKAISVIGDKDLVSANTVLEGLKKDNANKPTKSYLMRVCKDRGMMFNKDSNLFELAK